MPTEPNQKIRLTEAQAAAVAARGGSLLVSAAAGSGKTRVLVERAVGLITDPTHPIDADRLLIMTFTNAAAAKLRTEIADRLAAAVRENPADTRLRGQQLRLQRASIGTVDAFCLHFVQRHFAALDIPPDFETGEEAELDRIEQETLQAVLEDAYKDADFRAFADLYDRGRADTTAGETVRELYRFSRALPHPDAALQAFADQWQSPAPPEETAWGRAVLESAARTAADARDTLRAAAQTARQNGDICDTYGPKLEDEALRVERLRQIFAAGGWDDAVAALDDLPAWGKLPIVKGGQKSNPAAAAAAALCKAAHGQIDKLREELLLCTAAQYEDDRRRAAPLVAALVRVTRTFADTCFAARCAEKRLDYSDYEHLTLDLLIGADGRRTQLCGTVSDQYDAVMVDEYQDTNALQDAIYAALAHENRDNLFFVGDIKQSIYRFRQADPSVFIEKQEQWQPYPQPKGAPASLALDANFRSAKNVIEGINYLFSTVFSRRLGGVEYGPGQRLVPGLPSSDYDGLCEADVLPGADARAEADTVAARIEALHAQGFLVRGKQGQRPCQWDDFCILLRGRVRFDVYEAALRARGIPVFADTADDLLDAPHVRPFAALLRVIDNPAQDIPLASVLLSPMFPYTPDDLVALRAAVPKGSLYGAVLHGGQEKFAPFVQTLAEFRRLARALPVDALLEELLARTGYLAAVGAMPDGPRCRDDLHAFAAWAAAAGRAGLPALVRAMDAAARGAGLCVGGGGQSRPGCVSVMTVHRSKGLEFPIVFVADTAHQFNLSDARRPVLCHSRLGVGLTLRAGQTPKRYRTVPHAALAQAIRAETLSEEMRVLYVALTRAQDALFIMLTLKNAKIPAKPALWACTGTVGPTAQSWADWLLTAALRHPNGCALWQYSDLSVPPDLPASDAPLTIRVQAPAEAPASASPDAAAEADRALYEQLLENFAWRDPDAALCAVPAKVSVSAVAHAARDVVPERPAFLQKDGLTGAERGTALHAFLQSVPFGGAQPPDPAAEVRRQVELRLLDPALAQRLDLAALRPFFEGPVWRRIGSARQILREEPFITALPACEVTPEAGQSTAPVLVQGIADLVLVFDDHAEILDYKTDRAADPAFYRAEYAAQLRLYRRAFAKRLPVPVTKLTIYSFTLSSEIDIPLSEP